MSSTSFKTDSLRERLEEIDQGVSMEQLIEKYNLGVKKIDGEDEYEMYRNYINNVKEKRIKNCLDAFLTKAEAKDDIKAEDIHDHGHTLLYHMSSKIYECHSLYTESLRYAVYNGRQYAKALVSRAITNYKLQRYKNCLTDIEMALNADCPKYRRLEMIYYKGCCYERMGNKEEMKTALVMLTKELEGIPESTAEAYKIASLDLLLKCEDDSLPKGNDASLPDVEVPTIEENPLILNASSAVRFEFDEKTGYRVIANRDITTGDVLFVEKAFAYASSVDTTTNYSKHKETQFVPIICHYCIKLTDNAIPCKKCVYIQYCDENCRDRAWDEFHHWECVGVSPEILSFNNHGYLALRIIFRAVSTGLSISNLQLKDKPNKYGDKDNNYPYVCSLPTNLNRISKRWLTLHCATAAFYVQFLKDKTDFFSKVKKLPGYRKKSRDELHDRIGGLIVRHCAQLHCYVTLVKTVYIPSLNADKIIEPGKLLTTAMAIYPSIAIMRHSCAPNTAQYFVKDVAVVKATVDVKQNEEIFRAYTSVLFSNTSIKLECANSEEKKGMLKKFCFINCKCEICANPIKKEKLMFAYLCIKCRGAAVKSGNQAYVQCVSCNHIFYILANTLDKENFVENGISKFQNEGRNNVEDLYKCLQVCEEIYYPQNKAIVIIHDELANYHVKNGNAKEYLMYTKQQMNIIKGGNMSMMEYSALIYAVCVVAINILKGKLPENEPALEEILDELEAALSEIEDILHFYCPSFIYYINKFRQEISRMRGSCTGRSI